MTYITFVLTETIDTILYLICDLRVIDIEIL